MDRKDTLDVICKELVWFDLYANVEVDILKKVREIIEWRCCENQSKCPYGADEVKKIAEDLCEIASFRYGGDMELFKTSADYRRGRLAAMGNLSGFSLAEMIAELFDVAEELS